MASAETDSQPPIPSVPSIPKAPKLTRAQQRYLRYVQRNIKDLEDEVNRRIREGDDEGADEIGLMLIEVFQGTARLTASTRRLELATYILIALTGLLALFTYLLWAHHF